MSRSYHQISRSAASACADEKAVMVYDSNEFAQLKSAQESGDFDSGLMSSAHCSKFFSLMPFMIESQMTPKQFVLRMELYPNAGFLKMHALRMSGVHTFYVPVKQMIPITKYDYWGASWKLWFKQH